MASTTLRRSSDATRVCYAATPSPLIWRNQCAGTDQQYDVHLYATPSPTGSHIVLCDLGPVFLCMV